MTKPAETYPAQITVFCDRCGYERTGDYVVTDRMTRAQRLAAARRHLDTNEGWSCTAAGDLCPKHAAPAPADTPLARLQDAVRRANLAAPPLAMQAVRRVYELCREHDARTGLIPAHEVLNALGADSDGEGLVQLGRTEWVLLCRPAAAVPGQDWTVVDSWPEDERPQAAAALEHHRAGFPAIEYRLAQATTVYTADGEQL